MNVFIIIATIFVSSTPVFAQNSQNAEYKKISGNEKLYFSVNAPNISEANTYEVEAIVDHPSEYSLTYDPLYSHDSQGYLIAKDTILLTAAQIKKLITDNPSDFYDEEIKKNNGLIAW